MILLRLSLFFSILFLWVPSIAQYSVEGKVVELGTGEPLAFVNIVINGSVSTSTSTDIDGLFRYQLDEEIKTLSFSFIWYEVQDVSADTISDLNNLVITLVPTVDQLQQVTILPGENPAHRIIRNTIKNKDLNNPKKIASYQYKSYTKVVYDMQSEDSTLMAMLNKTLKGGHMMVMESVTEKKYKAPNLEEEIIIGTKVSGFKFPSFGPLATDLQPFSFYENLITIFDITYLNPIANGSINKYIYHIEDTVLHESDTTFIISFQPKPKKNFDGLKGLLYINTNKFAVQNVIASPYEKGLIDVKIQQEYEFVDGKQWFPKQLNFELTMLSTQGKRKDSVGKPGDMDLGITSNGKSYITDVVLFPTFKNRDFGVVATKLGDGASARDSLFWERNRHRIITVKDSITYDVMDSLGQELKLDQYVLFMGKLAQGKIPVKFIDIDIPESLVQNVYEGYRVGLGLSTNERISKVVSIGGFAGYGLKDFRWKYGGHFNINLSKEHEIMLSGKVFNTLDEVGHSELSSFSTIKYGLRQYMTSRLSQYQGMSVSLGFRALRYFKVKMSAVMASKAPLFDYQYMTDTSLINSYELGELKVGIRFAFREKLIESFNQRISLGTKFPVLTLHFAYSEKGLLNSDYSYSRVELRLEDDFKIKNVGVSKIRIDAGYIDQSVPYDLQFTGEGSLAPKRPFITPNYFQTIAPYEFQSDQYVNVFFTHNFGSLLLNSKKFKPQILIHQNIGWGTLSNANQHHLVDFKTKEKGFYEAGLQMNNLLRINYLNVGYIGIGVGAYYRYGPYAFSDYLNNTAFKISMVYSSK